MQSRFDIIVIGGGHAGIEAALASARMGANTALFTLKLEAIARLSCNPSLGGPAKGHLAREIDAMGGEMGRVADLSGIHFRMLNLVGSCVWAPCAQNDREIYSSLMRQAVNSRQSRLIEAEITELILMAISLRDAEVLSVKTICCEDHHRRRNISRWTHTHRQNQLQGRAQREPSADELFITCKVGLKIPDLRQLSAQSGSDSLNYDPLEAQLGDEHPPASPFIVISP